MATKPRCDVRRARGLRCGGTLVDTIDRLGRVRWSCPKCERRKAGICQDCPRPVCGQRGKAETCADCRAKRSREADRAWRLRDPEHYREVATAIGARLRSRRRGNLPPMTRQESGKIAGKARAAALSPARRSEIARKAVETRWARVRAQASAQAAA